eukprot:1418030-Pyramimonas_sp.AAC.1
MTSLSEMQVGDLVIEVDLQVSGPALAPNYYDGVFVCLENGDGIHGESQEIKPKNQPCLLTEHDKAGPTFNLVNGRKYIMVLNMFREGGNMPNPVKAVRKLVVHTEDGTPLPLSPKPMKQNKALANCVSVSTPFDPADCRSTLLLTATQWPDVRMTTFEIFLELNDVRGREVPLVPTIKFQVWTVICVLVAAQPLFLLDRNNEVFPTHAHHQVHESETMSLKAAHAKSWAEDKYNNLSPSTRKIIKGMIIVAKMGVKAASGISVEQ